MKIYLHGQDREHFRLSSERLSIFSGFVCFLNHIPVTLWTLGFLKFSCAMVSNILSAFLSSSEENGWKSLIGSGPCSVFHQLEAWQRPLMGLKRKKWKKQTNPTSVSWVFLQMALVLLRWRTTLCLAAVISLCTVAKLILTRKLSRCLAVSSYLPTWD